MSFYNEWRWLVHKELKIEKKSKGAAQLIFLYSASTVFVCYWAIRKPTPEVWSALFWVVLVFTAIQVTARVFIVENKGRHYYTFQLASAPAIVLSKMAFNVLIMTAVALFTGLLFGLLMGVPVWHPYHFLAGMAIGVVSLANVLTLLSAIASKSGDNSAVLTVLAMPILLPALFLLISITGHALSREPEIGFLKDMMVLSLMNVIVFILSLFVFPYLWNE